MNNKISPPSPPPKSLPFNMWFKDVDDDDDNILCGTTTTAAPPQTNTDIYTDTFDFPVTFGAMPTCPVRLLYEKTCVLHEMTSRGNPHPNPNDKIFCEAVEDFNRKQTSIFQSNGIISGKTFNLSMVPVPMAYKDILRINDSSIYVPSYDASNGYTTFLNVNLIGMGISMCMSPRGVAAPRVVSYVKDYGYGNLNTPEWLDNCEVDECYFYLKVQYRYPASKVNMETEKKQIEYSFNEYLNRGFLYFTGDVEVDDYGEVIKSLTIKSLRYKHTFAGRFLPSDFGVLV